MGKMSKSSNFDSIFFKPTRYVSRSSAHDTVVWQQPVMKLSISNSNVGVASEADFLINGSERYV